MRVTVEPGIVTALASTDATGDVDDAADDDLGLKILPACDVGRGSDREDEVEEEGGDDVTVTVVPFAGGGVVVVGGVTVVEVVRDVCELTGTDAAPGVSTAI